MTPRDSGDSPGYARKCAHQFSHIFQRGSPSLGQRPPYQQEVLATAFSSRPRRETSPGLVALAPDAHAARCDPGIPGGLSHPGHPGCTVSLSKGVACPHHPSPLGLVSLAPAACPARCDPGTPGGRCRPGHPGRTLSSGKGVAYPRHPPCSCLPLAPTCPSPGGGATGRVEPCSGALTPRGCNPRTAGGSLHPGHPGCDLSP